MMMNRNRTILLLLLLVTVGVYGAVYVRLSVNGQYVPGCIGLNGVKWYRWAPSGFVATDVLSGNRTLTYIYLPCLYLDCRFWHTWDLARTEKYPVQRITREEANQTDLVGTNAEQGTARSR